MEAARRGVPVEGGVMYVTTFPCHECARHLIAGGLSRVVYIDPYPKSLAAELYEDAIALEGAGGAMGKVIFTPFVGIAPRRYMEFFELQGERKQKDGSVVPWMPTNVVPRHPADYAMYSLIEVQLLERFDAAIQKIGLKFRSDG
jgi:cytidine deaminase